MNIRHHKYNAKKVRLDGYVFDSKAEADRYGELRLLERANEIHGIEVHPIYPIEINGNHVCKVILDFRYRERSGRIVHEDVKGFDTALSKIKRKLVEATHGITVEVIK